jgi:hypothetical protein
MIYYFTVIYYINPQKIYLKPKHFLVYSPRAATP